MFWRNISSFVIFLQVTGAFPYSITRNLLQCCLLLWGAYSVLPFLLFTSLSVFLSLLITLPRQELSVFHNLLSNEDRRLCCDMWGPALDRNSATCLYQAQHSKGTQSLRLHQSQCLRRTRPLYLCQAQHSKDFFTSIFTKLSLLFLSSNFCYWQVFSLSCAATL